jgi:ATP-dependent protease HslVU (ClpYQ) peptidase subunit
MTTVVFDGKILAADGRATCGTLIVTADAIKIFNGQPGMVVHGEAIIAYGFAGRFDCIDAVTEWLINGADFYDLREIFENDDAGFQLLVVTDTTSYITGDGAYGWMPNHSTAVLGSGTDAAMSALMFGRNAIEAVQHAMKMDTGTGGTIRYINCRDDKHVLKSL